MFRLGKAKRLVDWLVFLFSTDPNEIQFHVDVEIVTIQATHNQYIIQKVISKFYIEKNRHSQTSICIYRLQQTIKEYIE